MLNFEELDHEFLTEGNPDAEAHRMAGLIEQNLTPEEQARLKEIAPILEEYNSLMVKIETGKSVEELENSGELERYAGPAPDDLDSNMAQEGQMQRASPLGSVEGDVPSGAPGIDENAREMPQNAPEMLAEGGYARSDTTMEQAYDIVRKKHPRQAKYLDSLNIVMNPDMAGHSEYRSGDYEDSDMYGGKSTIEINPRDSKTPEEIASTIAGETLHHMRDKDPEFRKMWLGLRETLGEDENFRKFQEKRQGRMNKMRQEEFIREGDYKNPVNNKGPYSDTRDVDWFIDASAMDEWIRAYQFKDDPIAGKHYDSSWQGKDGKGEVFHNQYKDQFEGIKQYLKKGMAHGGEVPPVIGQQQPTAGPGEVAAGPVGIVNQPGADNSGVGDDVPAKSDGFVLNAAAVRHAGLRDINDMIQGAIEYAKKQGIELDFGKTPVDAEQILVSNGEVVIPHVIAKIIGYDKLEKINNRGKKETEEKLAAQEEGAPPEGPPSDAPAAPPVLQDQMAGLT